MPNPPRVLVPKEGFTSQLLVPCSFGTSLFFFFSLNPESQNLITVVPSSQEPARLLELSPT